MPRHKSAKEQCPSRSYLYRHLARCYDPLFKRPLSGRICRTIRSLDIYPGARILDVGVGTGHYLGAYPRHSHVVGIDLSESMLEVAARSLRRHGWDHIELRLMDALHLEFEHDTFDFVVSFHTASVVSDPARMVREMLRVCRPGGTLAIINHFRPEQRWLASVVDAASPLTRRLGWRTDIGYRESFDGSCIEIEQRYKTSPLSLFTVVVGRKPAEKSASPSARPGASYRRSGRLPLPVGRSFTGW